MSHIEDVADELNGVDAKCGDLYRAAITAGACSRVDLNLSIHMSTTHEFLSRYASSY